MPRGRFGPDITGQVFGQLTAIKKVAPSIWEFECSCGTFKSLSCSVVKSGATKSCGCLRRRPKADPNDWVKHAMRNVESNSKKREYSFELTEEQFLALISKNCKYCGSPPANKVPAMHCKKNYQWLNVKWTGIDRLDNNLGYTVENSVPACKDCNMAKRLMTEEQFLAWVKRVYDHNNLGAQKELA